MRKQDIVYWAATALVAIVMAVSGALAIMHTPRFMQALEHLGYPPYFANILGAGKLAGVLVLLAPKLARLKEWAYACFAITVLSACYSHFSSGDGLLALDPLATFAALMVSYRYRPAQQRPRGLAESGEALRFQTKEPAPDVDSPVRQSSF
jgi:Flp pilus assembly protein protease CpaA